MKETDSDNLFNSIGFGFPDSPDALRSFNSIFKDHSFQTRVDSINPQKILAFVKKASIKITRVDYHKRTVLAAEIVYQLQNEWSMGHLKLQKLLYLCQNVLDMNIHANFSKQMMGPYDPILMRSLDKQFKEHKWFEFDQDDSPKYKHLENIGGHREWYLKYYHEHTAAIESMIETFRKMTTSQIELIATIYACWVEIVEKKEIFSNDLIVTKVYAWSKHKEKFSKENIISSIAWMTEKGISPNLKYIK